MIVVFSQGNYAQQYNFKNYTFNNGLPSNKIIAGNIDDIGYVWFATDKGVVKFDGIYFAEISNKPTTAIYNSTSLTILGHKNGLTLIKNNKETFLSCKEVLSFLKKDDSIFIATTEGVFELINQKLQPLEINSTLDFSIIGKIHFTNNHFYISSNNGLWKVDSLRNPKTIQKILEKEIITSVIDENSLIITTHQDEILQLENDKITYKSSTLKNVSSLNIIADKLWITSLTNGIEIRDRDTFSFLQNINKYNSIGTDNVSSIIESEKLILINTLNKGVYVTGYQYNNIYHDLNLKFEKFSVNGNSIDSLLQSKKSIVLNYDQNNLNIKYKTIALRNPNKVKYQYVLNGVSSNWSNNNEIQLPNLTYGNYSLQIQSKVDETKSEPQILNFKIDTPFYKKDAFFLITGVLLLIIAYLFLEMYLKHLKKKHAKELMSLKQTNHLLTLEQQALQLQMNPHFIFNVLNGIKALGNKGDVTELNKTINKFSILLRSVLNNSRREEITLKDELATIKNYIELEQSMSSKSFNYNIDLHLNNIDSDEILFPSMLLQPFIENSIEHGFTNDKPGLINIEITIINQYIEISIIDNGIGIDKSLKKKFTTNNNSLALKVTKERIQYLSNLNSYRIQNIKNKENTTGTKVFFKIPLKTDY
ncbi:Two-component system sensor histidine kinase [Polaribacter dokdonensis DSW-5]|uniref:Two-component system sensor histidine kinase n=1 Tax=Polaribacter dokdonensis DSW-5 TaxID=1300348 RepID=A0A0N0UNV4_9FLAO|nr:Two-component system sensor histidine kinase [Polaribacter dokdonensis DSW-5]